MKLILFVGQDNVSLVQKLVCVECINRHGNVAIWKSSHGTHTSDCSDL